MQFSSINYQNFEKPSRNPSNRTKVNIRKMFDFEMLAKTERKE